MKKHLSKILLAAFAVMLLSMSVLVGCGGSKLETIDDTVWKVTNYSASNNENSILEQLEQYGIKVEIDANKFTSAMAENMTMEFQNGVATLKIAETTLEKKNYTYADGKLIIDGKTYNVGSNSFTIEHEGSSLTLSLVEGQKPEEEKDTLEGTKWNITKVSAGGVDMDMQQYAQAAGVSADSMYIEFKDGKAISNIGGETNSIDYTYENGKLVIDGQEVQVNGNTMKFENSGVSMTLEKQIDNTYAPSFGFDSSSTPASLDGTKWGIDSVSYNGVSMDVAQFAKMSDISVDEMIIDFKDGKAIAGGDTSSAVDYTYEDGKVTIQGITFTVNGDTMEAEQNGAKIVMKRK